jgi:CelD/BcsL family acetyltransferase involved in cellulose biosynthesis
MLDTSGSTILPIAGDRKMLDALLPQWRELAQNAAEDCVYYAPHMAMPLLETVAAKTNLRFVTAWAGDRLVALLPVVPVRFGVPGLVPAGSAWQTDYTFSCTPLLDSADPARAAEGLVAGLSGLGRGEWMFRDMNVDGPACQAILGALRQKGAPFRIINAYERAALEPALNFEDHMQKHVESKRRRELSRNRRRFEELGRVEFRTATHGSALREAAKNFLDLEAGGWKGKRGTALACQPETRRFAELAFGTAADEGNVRIDQLLLDGKPVAAGVMVFAGRTGFTVKGAYDEAYANYSAGLLLEVDILRDFLTKRWASRLDAATNGGHVIDRLWPARTKVADLVFSLADSAASARLDCHVNMLRWKQQAKSFISPYVERLRAA